MTLGRDGGVEGWSEGDPKAASRLRYNLDEG